MKFPIHIHIHRRLSCVHVAPNFSQNTAVQKRPFFPPPIVAKAHARASLIHKCFLSKDRSILVKAYVTYVRPLLEYAVHVWSPYQLEDIARIESSVALQNDCLVCLMMITVVGWQHWVSKVLSYGDSIRISCTHTK